MSNAERKTIRVMQHKDGGLVWTWCRDCGPNVTVDEDGCCTGCGRDALFSGDIDEGVRLSAKQKGEVIGLARMFLTVYRGSGDIVDFKTGETQSPREYANSVLAACGIDAKFQPPAEPRDPKTLRVVSEAGESLAGKVTRDLETATRNKPERVVRAVLCGGWWRVADSVRPSERESDPVSVRVVAA